jgi:DNA-binding transcriptional LysR family regulator
VERGELVSVFPAAEPERLAAYAFYPNRESATLKVSRFVDFFAAWLSEHLPQSLPTPDKGAI